MSSITYVGLDVHKTTIAVVRFHHPGQQVVLQDYIDAVITAEQRVARLTQQIMELMRIWSMAPVATAIEAMRGVALINAVTIVAEVGNSARFGNAGNAFLADLDEDWRHHGKKISTVLREKYVRKCKEKAGLPEARRGKKAVALDAAGAALGSFGRRLSAS